MKELLHSFQPNTHTPYYISMAGITYANPNYRICIQSRGISVIEYVISGKGYVLVENRYKEVSADMIYFLKKGDRHEYFADKKEPFTKIFLNISGPFAREIASMFSLANETIFVNKELRPIFERVPRVLCSSKGEEEMQIELQLILNEIFTKLSYQHNKEKYSKEAVILKEYIEKNSNRIVSNAELAGVIFRSVDYCQKLFLKEYGVTPYTYQINMKIMMAKNLIINTDFSIGEIGASLGYNDQHYFSNIFKSKTGFSPLSYRKKHVNFQ